MCALILLFSQDHGIPGTAFRARIYITGTTNNEEGAGATKAIRREQPAHGRRKQKKAKQ